MPSFPKNGIPKITSVFAKEATTKECSAVPFHDFDGILTCARTRSLVENFPVRG